MYKKNMVYKLLITIMTFVLVFSTSSGASAAVNSNFKWIVKKDNNKHIYLQNTKTGEKMVDAISLDDSGNPIHLDLKEYAKILNCQQEIKQDTSSTNKVKDLQSIEGTTPSLSRTYQIEATYSYVQSYATTTTGMPSKVTPDIVGPTTVSYGNSVSFSESFSVSVSINGEMKKVIKGGATFTWNSSATTSANFGLSYQIPAGKTGYVSFSPYYNITVGNLTTKLWQDGVCFQTTTTAATGYSPKVLANGIADGIYALMIY
jgi:hypothetical protein